MLVQNELTLTELRRKEVINMTDGRRLGRIVDLVIDVKCGKVCGFIVPGKCGGFIGKNDELFIPWCDICKIGDDVILVELKIACVKSPHCRTQPRYAMGGEHEEHEDRD